MMREAGRVQLSKQLYDRAHEIDPERASVYVEKLALSAQINYKQREESLKQVRNICIERPSVSAISRTANVLIDLDRYNELLEFSDALLAAIGNSSIALRILALRNKAVALKEIGRTDEAIEVYKLAFSISPDDENTLKPYLGVLEEQGKGKSDEYLALAKRLIVIDPADIRYYLIYISALMERRMYEDATKWLARADMLPKSGRDEARLKEWGAKIKIATEIAATASD